MPKLTTVGVAAEEATLTFDRGGSDEGVLLGHLNLNGVRDVIRLGHFFDNHVEPRLVLPHALGFDELKPSNVAFGPFRSTTTDRDRRSASGRYDALCDQVVDGWFRTDVEYASECESIVVDTRNSLPASPETPSEFRSVRALRSLPELQSASAESLGNVLGIPTAPLSAED